MIHSFHIAFERFSLTGVNVCLCIVNIVNAKIVCFCLHCIAYIVYTCIAWSGRESPAAQNQISPGVAKNIARISNAVQCHN